MKHTGPGAISRTNNDSIAALPATFFNQPPAASVNASPTRFGSTPASLEQAFTSLQSVSSRWGSFPIDWDPC